ncbi:hypothetical protein [Longimicrobium sp.]|jgi:hypothetical protein|uniref:hypothetical protein n=1 Tax=Longimicrobium sp. TaxID=2029185 RepID=UPI002ED840FF
MHDDLSAPASPATGSEINSPFGAVARLLGLPEPGLGFSVPPRHRGGIEARSGLAFQDEDALRQIGRLLRQDGQRALSVRLEGAGDTDVLALRQGGGLVEEYRQVKGRREGLARWSLAELGREGVWSEFIRTTTAFVQRAGADRSLLLVFVTDGELDTALQALRDDPAAFRNGSAATSAGRDVTRGALLMHCALGLLSPPVAARIQTAAGRDRLRQLCDDVARVLDHAWLRRDGVADAAAEWPAEAADAVASLATRPDGQDGSLLSVALQDAARHLDLLLESLRFESRVGRSGAGAGDDDGDLPAGQAEMVLVLIEAGRLDAAAAREALRKLRVAVADGSLVGATLDEGAVRRITDLPAPLELESFPDPVGARIRRVGTEPAILRGLRTHRAVWIYGPPRVGKTEAVRAALERGRLQERTVWLRLSGDGADIDRIWLHLAFWIGERTGNRELYRALRSGGVHAVEVRGQIARAGGVLRAVVVADDVSRIPATGRDALLASLEEARLGGAWVVAVAEDRPSAPAAGFPASAEPVAIEGFTMAEALQFWRALEKVPSNDAAMVAAMQILHRTAGHPEILRLIAGGLPDTPSAAELDAVRDALPAGEGASLLRELAWKLFRAGSADDFQRGLIPRVAVATHEVTEAQARAIAAVDPPLRWSAFGWLDLNTTLLEEVRRGRYRLPPIYQAVARMAVAGDDALNRAVHRACAETVLEHFSRERTIDWPDLYQVTLDYLFALEWKQAALNALWLANSAPPIPAAQECLQLALLPFRGPAAMTCGLEPDLHVAVLGASVMAERRMGDAAGTRDALEAMRRVAAAGSGEAGYRARTVAALFTAVDASLGGDHDAAFAAVDPAWREAAEHGDTLQLRLLGDIRLSAAAFGATGAGVVLEQIEPSSTRAKQSHPSGTSDSTSPPRDWSRSSSPASAARSRTTPARRSLRRMSDTWAHFARAACRRGSRRSPPASAPFSTTGAARRTRSHWRARSRASWPRRPSRARASCSSPTSTGCGSSGPRPWTHTGGPSRSCAPLVPSGCAPRIRVPRWPFITTATSASPPATRSLRAASSPPRRTRARACFTRPWDGRRYWHTGPPSTGFRPHACRGSCGWRRMRATRSGSGS